MRLWIIGGLAVVVVLITVGGLAYFLSGSAGIAGICGRTPQVQDAILEELARDRPGISCNEVTPEQLGTVKNLDMVQERTTELKADDFEGLTNLESIDLFANRLVSLPERIFNNTPNLKVLNLSENKLVSLPEGIFDKLNNLETLNIFNNDFDSLDDEVFDGLGNLEVIIIGSSDYRDSIRRSPTSSSLPESFYGLTNLRKVYITPDLIFPDVFENMTKLEGIYINGCVTTEAFGSRTDDFYSIQGYYNRPIRICS